MKLSRFLLILIFALAPLFAKAYTYADSSKLAKGDWYKIRIPRTGIYKLTYSDLLAMGIKKPAQAKIYGYGGRPHPLLFSESIPDDLPQVPIWREKGSDGVFNQGDYLLFFGQGPLYWEYDRYSSEFVHKNNPYVDYGYYFVSEGGDVEVNEIKTVAAPTVSPTLELTTYNYYVVHEKDQYNYLKSGQEFYGETFSSSAPQSFSFSIPNITQDKGRITVDMVSKVDPAYPARMLVSVNGNEVINRVFPTSSASDTYTKARSALTSVEWTDSKSSDTRIGVTYSRKGYETARLNYIRLNCKVQLSLVGSQTFFRSIEAINNSTKYKLQNTSSNAMVWDVTSPIGVSAMSTQVDGDGISFAVQNSQLAEYVVLNPQGSFSKPDVVGKVANQNLHAIDTTQMIIITQPDLISQAEVLANIHRVRDNMSVAVILPEQIYNEFSSGTPDATAYRWFMKMLQERSRGGEFLLLFGDGTYDNRLLTSDSPWTNPFSFILTYQSPNAISDFDSYVTDDYFGFTETKSTESLGNNRLTVAIGRIPVSTLTDARAYVAKVLTYMNNKVPGAWKNNITYMADDEDNNLHMSQADYLAGYVEKNNPEFVVNKVYIDAFKQISSAVGSTYPDAKRRFMNLIDAGQLIVNYTGHGNTISLTGEDMLNMNDINNFHTDKLALWVTATCDFTRFDDKETSAGEMLLLNKKSGAVASFSTTRIVNSAPNFELNKALVRNIFQRNNGKRLRLGEIIRNTKLSMGAGENKLNFALFGDPAMFLSYPEYYASLTEFKSKAVEQTELDTISALEVIELKGVIKDTEGNIATTFNGKVTTTVYDCTEEVICLNNDGKANDSFAFDERSRMLYSGLATVENGIYTVSFMVPKDNSYSYRSGMINLYAVDDSGANEAQGYYNKFVIGGTSNEVALDTIGPGMAVYLNSTSFKSGDKVDENPLFIAYIKDDSGINMSGNGIGHDLVLLLDDNTSQPIVLNNYLENQGTEGIVRYRLENLPEGKHTLYFKAWDIINNSSSTKVEFEVIKGLRPDVYEAYTVNDNQTGITYFMIQHDRPNSELEVSIEVSDLSGKSVWATTQSIYSSGNQISIPWPRVSYGNSLLPTGVYVYRVNLKSGSSSKGEKVGKLAIPMQ